VVPHQPPLLLETEITQDESVKPQDLDGDQMAEEIQEDIQEEDGGNDVIENITSDAYLKRLEFSKSSCKATWNAICNE